ncbi:transglycosylase domain-containing protein [Campylobacter sp. RM9333]|uniref:biosynthetic peptidoglycan transglycosylase n=1 Tax=Campylobacter sp. RM9333 TaxID=2735731 RepID=UPI001DA954CD|nr:transglycosylase domain-containing protein [Campylobacter sp. RM9333]
MDWQQYFPTYKFNNKENRDIALEEYKFCCKTLESEEKLFDSFLRYITLVCSGIVSLLAFLKLDFIKFNIEKDLVFIVGFIFFLSSIFFIITTLNFATKQKNIVFAKRKIIILRRMLGMNYGSQEFLFKKGMLEGANMPFSIKLRYSYLYFIIPCLYASMSFFMLHWIGVNLCYSVLVFLTLYTILNVIYIFSILDINETKKFVVLKAIAFILDIKLVDNFEHVLYRAKLAQFEFHRLKIDLKYIKDILIAIEDKNFRSHKGIDIKAISRAMLSQLKKIPLIKHIKYINKFPYSGGSTITQQLFRTLFIENIADKKIRRKIVEILFSRFWLNEILKKDEQLEIYLAAVRFDKNIFGAIKAYNYFFDNNKINFNKAKSFILIERVSVTSGCLLPKVIDLIDNLLKNNILTKEDCEQILCLYKQNVEKGKIQKCYKNIDNMERLNVWFDSLND